MLSFFSHILKKKKRNMQISHMLYDNNMIFKQFPKCLKMLIIEYIGHYFLENCNILCFKTIKCFINKIEYLDYGKLFLHSFTNEYGKMIYLYYDGFIPDINRIYHDTILHNFSSTTIIYHE